MVIKQIVIPKRYLKTAKQKGTRSLRDSETGQMRGRVAMKSGKGDTTKSQYLTRNFDINQDGRIESNERAGTIHGRIERVKADNKKRGTIRRI